MQSGPLVSVIIPSYNAGKFIAAAVDSVLGQTYKNYEIVVVDDGSTDNTKEVLKPYIDQGKIRYIYQENKKQAAARNNGIKHSRGELLAFLDADDVWLPGKLELQVPLFRDEEVGMVYGNGVIWENGSERPRSPTKGPQKGNIFYPLMVYGSHIWASTVILRRECVDKVGLFNESKSYVGTEDYDMWLRVAYHYKVDYVPEVVEKYRIHGDNVSLDTDVMFNDQITVVKDVARLFHIPKSSLDGTLARIYFELSYRLIEEVRYKEALKYALLTVFLRPGFFNGWKMLVKAMLYGLLKNGK